MIGKAKIRYAAKILRKDDNGAGGKGATPQEDHSAIYAKRKTVGVATRVAPVAPRGIGALPTSKASLPRTGSSSFSTAEDAGVSSPEQYESESRERERDELDDAQESVVEFACEELSTSSSVGDVAPGSIRHRSSPPLKGSWTPTEARKSSESFAERVGCSLMRVPASGCRIVPLEAVESIAGVVHPLGVRTESKEMPLARDLRLGCSASRRIESSSSCGDPGRPPSRGSDGDAVGHEAAGMTPVEELRSRLGRRDGRLKTSKVCESCLAAPGTGLFPTVGLDGVELPPRRIRSKPHGLTHLDGDGIDDVGDEAKPKLERVERATRGDERFRSLSAW